jgi:hypothetical protein
VSVPERSPVTFRPPSIPDGVTTENPQFLRVSCDVGATATAGTITLDDFALTAN